MLKITAIGNLTSDVELKTKAGSETPYAILRIASDRRYKDREGRKLTDFVSIKVRGGLAESCAEYLGKGDKIAATGDFETVRVEQEDGSIDTGFLIKAFEVDFLHLKRHRDITEFDINEPAELFDEALAEINL